MKRLRPTLLADRLAVPRWLAVLSLGSSTWTAMAAQVDVSRLPG